MRLGQPNEKGSFLPRASEWLVPVPSRRLRIGSIQKMACLVSSSLTLPLCASSLTKHRVHQLLLDFSLDKLLSKATIQTAQKMIGSRSSNKHVLSVKGSCQRCFMSCPRFLHETYTYNLDVDYCTEIVISGYWVGPDVDDGWGFVEAVINQMN